MFNVGGSEILVISLVALIVLGPSKLPEVARQVGKIYADFKRVSNGFQRDFREAMRDPVGDAIRDVTATAELAPIEQTESAVASATSETDTAEPETLAMDNVVDDAATDPTPEEPLVDDDPPPIESDR